MDCSVIYYAARKTSFCEKALNRCLSPLHLRISSACFANGAQQLGERLIEASGSCRVRAAADTCSGQAASFSCFFPTTPAGSRRSSAAI